MSKKICVFCGARLGDSENYEKVAIELGREIVRRGHSLIYGGGSVGLMGAVAWRGIYWRTGFGGFSKVFGSNRAMYSG